MEFGGCCYCRNLMKKPWAYNHKIVARTLLVPSNRGIWSQIRGI